MKRAVKNAVMGVKPTKGGKVNPVKTTGFVPFKKKTKKK